MIFCEVTMKFPVKWLFHHSSHNVDYLFPPFFSRHPSGIQPLNSSSVLWKETINLPPYNLFPSLFSDGKKKKLVARTWVGITKPFSDTLRQGTRGGLYEYFLFYACLSLVLIFTCISHPRGRAGVMQFTRIHSWTIWNCTAHNYTITNAAFLSSCLNNWKLERLHWCLWTV